MWICPVSSPTWIDTDLQTHTAIHITDIPILVLMGQVAAIIKDIKPARQIVEDMVREAVAQLKLGQSYLQEGGRSRL